MKRVVITGVGAVTPLGNDAGSSWQGLVEGRSGIRPLTTFDATGFPVRIAGQVTGFNLRENFPVASRIRYLSRSGEFGVAAALEALADAGIPLPGAPEEQPDEHHGAAIGTSVGRPGLQQLVDIAHTLRSSDGTRIYRHSPAEVLGVNPNVSVNAIARLAGFGGPLLDSSTACSASAHALGEAFRLIQEGDATLMLAGGYDSLTTWLDVTGFSLLGALTDEFNDNPEGASRPFAEDRSGFVLGEGAVIFVLEELDSARERGARVLAEILGYASSLNAYRITDSPPDGGGAVPAMQLAVEESGLGPERIDYIAAHGTSTPGNDASETVAIKKVFGEHAHRVAISSTKSMIGHLTAAGAAANLLAAVGAIRDLVVPPTVNLDHPDPGLDLDYVPLTARRMPVRAALVNSFAFGGTNACLVVGAYSEEQL